MDRGQYQRHGSKDPGLGLEDNMNADDLRAQIIRLEGFADGIKQGAALLAQWMISEMKKEAAKTEPPLQEPPQ
jgi:hypothetical protein